MKVSTLKFKIPGLFIGVFFCGWFLIASRDANSIKPKVAEKDVPAGSVKEEEENTISGSESVSATQERQGVAIYEQSDSSRQRQDVSGVEADAFEEVNRTESQGFKTLSATGTDSLQETDNADKENTNQDDAGERIMLAAETIDRQEDFQQDSVLDISIVDPDQPEVETTTS